ncbi:MAG: hypothetical protein WAV09_03080 [Minisyncoccia bacterium]
MAYLMPEMIVALAEAAKIKVPPNLEKYDTNEFPHWHVLLNTQLGASLPTPDAGWHNARVIAAIPDKRIRKVTMADLRKLGCLYGDSSMFA